MRFTCICSTFVRNRSNGSIYAFGLNNYSQLGINKKSGDTVFSPQLTSLENVKTITGKLIELIIQGYTVNNKHFFVAGGQHHTLILTNANKSYAIGRKDYGRLGIGQYEEELVDKLTLINKLDSLDVIQLDCGECCSFAITADGKAYSWGMGSNLQLGVGSDDDQFEPVLLTGVQVRDREVIRISSGGQHTLFLAVDKDATTNGNHKNGEQVKPTNGTKADSTTQAKPDANTTKTNGNGVSKLDKTNEKNDTETNDITDPDTDKSPATNGTKTA